MARNQRRSGRVRDPRVITAMERVPREAFVPDGLHNEAFTERALPIGEGQTISQPLIVAMMTEALELQPDDRVLEIGTGSGYQSAVLRQLVHRVVSIERIAALADHARGRLEELGIDGVEIHCADGTLGWPEDAPYDAVVVTAGGPRIPNALLDQLAEGARLVMPIGERGDERLVQFRNLADAPSLTDLGPVAFVPLVGEQGW